MTIEQIKRAELLLRRQEKYVTIKDHVIKNGGGLKTVLEVRIKTPSDTVDRMLEATNEQVMVFLSQLIKDSHVELASLGVDQ